jgi:hypothetical protein
MMPLFSDVITGRRIRQVPLVPHDGFRPLETESRVLPSRAAEMERRGELEAKLGSLRRIEQKFALKTSGRPMTDVEHHDWGVLQRQITAVKAELVGRSDWRL